MARLKTRNPRGQFTKLLFKRCDVVFEKLADKVINNAQGILKKKKADATGVLSNSLRADTLQDEKKFMLRFWFEDYGAFVEQGVRGSQKQWSYVDSSENRKLNTVGRKYPKLRQKGGRSPFSYKTKMPPIQALEKWFKDKGVQGRSKLGRFISHKSFAFIVQRNIFVNGIRAVFFYRDSFAKFYNDKLITDIETAYALDVEDVFAQLDTPISGIQFK